MFLGLDSTDSVQGGCTTHVTAELWRQLSSFDVRAGPRLVRLNPNVPYKTRGNGALCLELGHGVGQKRLAGVVRGVELWAYPKIEEPTRREQSDIVRTAKEVIAQRRSADANTGFVATIPPVDPLLYHAAVSEHVAASEAVPGFSMTWGTGRGLIGAIAAAAWPAQRGTYELIAYRQPSRWGTRRGLPLSLGAELEARAPSSFDNWDPVYEHLRVAPASPCPILAGVRASRPDELPGTLDLFDSEPVDSWMVFMTNQASGDHLRNTPLNLLKPFDSARLSARVAADPTTRSGGHVLLPIEDHGANAMVAAYEPTKDLRDSVRGLREGDHVTVEASAHDDPRRLALEAIEIVDATPRRHEAQRCGCGGTAPSKGRHAGRICATCGKNVQVAVRSLPGPTRGRVTVPVCIRRHLATPPGFSAERLRLAPGGIAA